LRSTDYPSALFNFEGRRAFITGASRGLGPAFAEAFAGAGASVILAGRARKELSVLYSMPRSGGIRHREDAERSEEDEALYRVSSACASLVER
jgi:NAD(P)-dependent dehydrogenase (short-subunit alcohol dehydrogenase family)